MKKIYEVPAMEIVRLDASENIAKLPTIDNSATVNAGNVEGKVTTKTRTTNLVQALLGGATSTSVEA